MQIERRGPPSNLCRFPLERTMTALPFPETTPSGPAVGNGPIRFGSEEHKRFFCTLLLGTFNPYRPAVIDWPTLEPETQVRLTALSLWDSAVQTENRAGMTVCPYA